MISDVQAREELLNFLRRAVDYFDREAESAPRLIDPAQLHSEGAVVLRRIETERDRR